VDLPLAVKLTFFTSVTSAVSMTVVCAILGGYNASAMRARLVTDTERLLNGVEANSAATLLFVDVRLAEQTVRTVALDEQVLTVALLQPRGQVLARYDRRPQPGGAPELRLDPAALNGGRAWHAFSGGTLSMTRPVSLDRKLVGTIYVELDQSGLRADTNRLWRIIGYAWLGASVVAGLLGWWLQRIVSQPILGLAQVTRDVVDRHDLGVRATKVADDEIGALVDRFNAMLDDIQHHDHLLNEYRLDLERMVERRTAELKAKTGRYRLLLESTRAVVWEVDVRTFTMCYVAPQITTLSGHDPLALIGESAWALVHPLDHDRLQGDLRALLANPKRGIDVEHRHLTVAQQTLYVRSMVSLHRLDEDGTVVLRGITVDITRHKRLEMELRHDQKLESMGRLAAGVAHEINTPVQFVNDSVHFVRDALADLANLTQAYRTYCALAADGAVTPEATDALHALEEAADVDYVLEHVPKALDRSLDGLGRVAAIVRSMKEFAHPDQSEMAAVDLNQAIRSTLTIARSEYKYVADLHTDFGELPLVTCHCGDINQVVLNIVVNAAHAIKDVTQGTERRGRITVQTRRAGDAVVVTIGDTGTGIPDDVREHIFEPFFTTKEVGRGTGQGLAIARAVVLEKHGGSLTFETDCGQGTVFTMRLPIDGRRVAA
jgi:PAS domain S-box-containing protein